MVDRQMTWDEVVEQNKKLKQRIKQLEEERSVLNESISEYDKGVNALQTVNEQLEDERRMYLEEKSCFKEQIKELKAKNRK